jgi:hypothetical protein
MLAHVSYSRPDYIELGDHWWDSSAMLILTLVELEKFLARLPKEERPWFPSTESLKKRQEWAQFEVDQRGSTKTKDGTSVAVRLETEMRSHE